MSKSIVQNLSKNSKKGKTTMERSFFSNRFPQNKEEEIEFFNELVELFSSSDTYLRDLFSPQLNAWIEEHIRNDFPTDLFDLYRELNGECEKLNSTIVDQSQEIRDWNLRLIEMEMKAVKAMEEAELRREEAEAYADQIQTMKFAIEDLQKENEILRLTLEKKELEAKLAKVSQELERISK